MKTGSFKQKANWFVVGFVFGCIFITTILLFAMVKAEDKAEALSYATGDYNYFVNN